MGMKEEITNDNMQHKKKIKSHQNEFSMGDYSVGDWIKKNTVAIEVVLGTGNLLGCHRGIINAAYLFDTHLYYNNDKHGNMGIKNGNVNIIPKNVTMIFNWNKKFTKKRHK